MFYGVKQGKIDLRDYKLKVAKSKNNVLPENFELSYVPEAKNQGNVNSCVAHVASSIEEYFEKLQCNDTSELSPGFIYGTRYEYRDQGMFLRDALKTLLNKGICKKADFPYNLEVPEIIKKLNDTNIIGAEHRKITRYFKVKTIAEIKSAIYNHGPVMASVFWHSDNVFEIEVKDKNATIIGGTDNTENSGYHCIYIYGWNTEGFKILNSWGKKWGNKGTAVLPYSYKIEEAYGVEDNIVPSEDIKIITKNKLILILLNMLNKLLNIILKKGD